MEPTPKARRNKILLIVICCFNLIIFNLNLHAEEFSISAVEVSIDKTSDIVIGKGSVTAIDSQGNQIKADKITYNKAKEFLAGHNIKIRTKLFKNCQHNISVEGSSLGLEYLRKNLL